MELEQRFALIQRQQDNTAHQAQEALDQISHAFGRLQEVQAAQDASIKLTPDNANLVSATISKWQIENLMMSRKIAD